MKKAFWVFLISIFSIFCLSAVEQTLKNYAFLYEDALVSFDERDYGKALKLCEDAILSRKLQITSEIEILHNAIQPRQVQRVGSRISDIIKVLNERDEYDAVNLINFYLKKKGEPYFQDNINTFLQYLESIKVYPEAQKLIGDIYKIEGEYAFAENYYRESLKNADVLDIPDQRYEILYLLAELSELQNDTDEREKRLLTILQEDRYYLDKAFVNSMKRTIKSGRKDSIEKFFSMYRADSYYMLKAYTDLADLYFSVQDYEKALVFSALSSITGYTKIVSVVSKRNLDFENSGISSVLFEASLYEDLVEWGNKNRVWDGFITLSKVALKTENPVFAESLLKTMAENSPDKNCQKEAVLLLN